MPLDTTAEPARPSLFVASLGSGIAMICLVLVSRLFAPDGSGELLVASMGASAVLMFCVPRGELSGPWAVAGGHLVSAAIGVTACNLIPETGIAAPLAVGAAICAMLVLRCLHPPGGATALSAVVGGGGLGYQFVLSPVLLNVIVMLVVAYVFHLPGRSYPFPAMAKLRTALARVGAR